MKPGLTIKNCGWRYLLRDLQGIPAFRPLSADSIQRRLMIPVAVTRWIEERHPELRARDRLHLVMVIICLTNGVKLILSGRIGCGRIRFQGGKT